MKKPRFKIGERVRARHTVNFVVNQTSDRLMSLQSGVNGVIVGATTRYLGTVMDNGIDEGASLIGRQSVKVWQIRQGYSNKPYEALDEDVVSLENSDDNIMLLKNDIPFRYNNEWHGINGYQNRAAMSFNSHGFDRDENGRFV